MLRQNDRASPDRAPTPAVTRPALPGIDLIPSRPWLQGLSPMHRPPPQYDPRDPHSESLRRRGYLLSTRHPWPTLLILVPLLTAYETGIVWLGGANPQAMRNGADAWLRWGLEAFGLDQMVIAPILLIALF